MLIGDRWLESGRGRWPFSCGGIGLHGIIYYVSAIYNVTKFVRIFSNREKLYFNPPDCCATAYKETYKHPSQTGWSAQEVHWINKFSVDALPSLTLILMTIQAGTAQLFKPWSCRGFLLRNSVRSRYIPPRTFWIRGVWRTTKFRFYTITVFIVLFISRAFRTIYTFLHALYKNFLAFRSVCKKHTSDWPADSTMYRAARWELGLIQGLAPGHRTAVSPVYILHRRAYVRPLSSVDDPPPVPYSGQFARCTHQRFLCLKRLLLTQTRIKRV